MNEDLIKRLENATGPDRELDAAIAVATFHEPHDSEDLIYAKPIAKDDGCEVGTFWRKSRSGLSLQRAPNYTTSIDAALTLVPENAAVNLNIYRLQNKPPIWCGVATLNDHWVTKGTAEGKSAAIALCIAALRARAAFAAKTDPSP